MKSLIIHQEKDKKLNKTKKVNIENYIFRPTTLRFYGFLRLWTILYCLPLLQSDAKMQKTQKAFSHKNEGFYLQLHTQRH